MFERKSNIMNNIIYGIGFFLCVGTIIGLSFLLTREFKARVTDDTEIYAYEGTIQVSPYMRSDGCIWIESMPNITFQFRALSLNESLESLIEDSQNKKAFRVNYSKTSMAENTYSVIHLQTENIEYITVESYNNSRLFFLIFGVILIIFFIIAIIWLLSSWRYSVSH